ncbi:hypothetical protein E4K72_20265 [Oxalobacteraceae bacterium OM1]|nr:hypothetical protein E4K72_20265 [Oxalobacteraceae bacterium OM1]
MNKLLSLVPLAILLAACASENTRSVRADRDDYVPTGSNIPRGRPATNGQVLMNRDQLDALRQNQASQDRRR